MDGSRFRSAAPGVVIVRSVDAPELAGARIVLVDLALGVDLFALVGDDRTVIAAPNGKDGVTVLPRGKERWERGLRD